MDFHAAMETFAEAWVAANTQTAVNSSETQSPPKSMEDLPTLLPKEQLVENRQTSPNKAPSPDKSAPTSSAVSSKTLPIHCIVEQSSTAVDSPEKPSSSTVELDSYAIVSSSTLFNEIVRAAMLKLGYTTTEAVAATGAIQFKNWKPLSFDVITDNSQLTVDDVLGELTSVATLRIRLSSLQDSSFEWTDGAVRSAVIELLKEMNQKNLAKLSPLCQPTISNIANSKVTSSYISNEKAREFGQWYISYRRQHAGNQFQEGAPRDSRLTFHSTAEIPQMRRWYQSCKNPSDDNFQWFADELNKGSARQQRIPVTANKLKIWWKNEKQREKRLGLQKTETAYIPRKRVSRSRHKRETQTQRLLNLSPSKKRETHKSPDHASTSEVMLNNPKLTQSGGASLYTSQSHVTSTPLQTDSFIGQGKEIIDSESEDIMLPADDALSEDEYLDPHS